MLKILEDSLNCYDKILFLETEEFIPIICQLRQSDLSNRNIMVLSPNLCVSQIQNVTFCQISEEETRQLIGIYFTYEFSDKFLLVSRNHTNYASLYRMVDMEILSMEEFLTALLK